MERRNRSIKALNELIYIDSLDDEERAIGLSSWTKEYLIDKDISDFDLEKGDLIRLSELVYKNLQFLKKHKSDIADAMNDTQKIKQFIKSKH
ncbi:MAG: hypothetical protein RBR23_08340 [Arcobacteraceae bacterium]|jgi:hypothetical protein|nr:hypothetical protein [Arcobacteraceae bacterium]